MPTQTHAATLPVVEHHHTDVGGAQLHHASAGNDGTPVLLVHGFPETWRAFRKLLPLLAATHRVHAVDLRGFGDSAPAGADHSSAVAAADLAALVERLGEGPVHLLGQDVGGATAYRLAATRPDLVRSLTAVEVALPGFGFEALADVAHGGAWHIGVLATPGVADALLAGRERWLIGEHLVPALTATPDAITREDVDAYVRAYAGPAGFSGAHGLYRSALAEADELRALAATPLAAPVLAVDGGSGPVTSATLRQVAADVTVASVPGVGHHVAMEAPDLLADALLAFLDGVDGRP